MQIEGAVECFGQVNEKSGAIKFDKNTNVSLANDQTANIGCTRRGIKDTKGNEVFGTATVTLFTNLVPNGNYAVYIPKQTILGTDDAAVIAGRLKVIEDNLKGARTALDTTNLRFDKMRFVITYTPRTNFEMGPPPVCPAGFKDTGAETHYSAPGGPAGVGERGRLCYNVEL